MYSEVLHDGLAIPECTCNPEYGEECVCEGRQELVHVEVDEQGTTHVYPIISVDDEEDDGHGQPYRPATVHREDRRNLPQRASREPRGPRMQ